LEMDKTSKMMPTSKSSGRLTAAADQHVGLLNIS